MSSPSAFFYRYLLQELYWLLSLRSPTRTQAWTMLYRRQSQELRAVWLFICLIFMYQAAGSPRAIWSFQATPQNLLRIRPYAAQHRSICVRATLPSSSQHDAFDEVPVEVQDGQAQQDEDSVRHFSVPLSAEMVQNSNHLASCPPAHQPRGRLNPILLSKTQPYVGRIQTNRDELTRRMLVKLCLAVGIRKAPMTRFGNSRLLRCS